ncbi:MAG: hypothetical protein DSY81_03770 [Bacillota bacterium]|nr:MAG: hypothetical protein DSY81_03770 [Bacillota bacterium]
MSTEREVLVVGGGPTGSIVATMLAQSGHQVLLVCEERREGGLPVETVVPGAVTTLDRLGLSRAVGECAIPGPARHGRCWSSSALDIEDLDDSHRGWRFLRPALDRWLRARARESGVEVMQATRATSPLPMTGCGEVKLEQAGRTALGGPETKSRHRPGIAEEPDDPDPRRGHSPPRSRLRPPDPRHHRRVDARCDHPGDHPPRLQHRRCRSNPGAR